MDTNRQNLMITMLTIKSNTLEVGFGPRKIQIFYLFCDKNLKWHVWSFSISMKLINHEN